MKTAIITANRICMTYCRKAMRLPIGMSPLSTRMLPNHRIATEDRLKTAISNGSITANMRLTRIAVAVRSAFATSNRSSSWRVRTKARMTRTPLSASRVTWLMRSTLTCIAWKSGSALAISVPTMRAMIGRMTTRMPASGTSWRRAMMIPPTARMGAMIIMLRPIRTTIWTCCTSFVLRVISDGVPKWLSSTWEKLSTLRKMAERRSRPNAIPVFEPQ